MTDSQRLVIVNGRVVTSDRVIAADVVVDGERITGLVAPGSAPEAPRMIDASGCYVFPGIIDAHTHIMLDTGIYRTVDSWEAGTRAAAFGGVTTVIDFANQIIGSPFEAALEARRAEAAEAVIDYAFHMVVLKPESESAVLEASLRDLLNLGVTSIKLFTTYRPNYYVDDATILRIFQAMPPGMIAMVHCENDSIVTDATQRLVAQGKTAWRYHAEARPAEAEAEAAHRILYLAKLAQARVYIVHNSTAATTAAVNQMRDRDGWAQVFCETCPQYLLLDDAVYRSDHPEHYILQPPLRAAYHTEALRRYVERGMVDVLATDSCDYSLAQKTSQPDFTRTPGGLPGLELLLPLMYTTFHDRVKLPHLIQMLSENPARLFGLFPRKGAVLPGSDADLVIYDPEPRRAVRYQELHHLAGYSPFEGMPLQGRVRTVISRGVMVVDNGTFLGRAGHGQFLRGGLSENPR